MEMRGRNRKWLGTVWVVGVDVVFKFGARVSQIGRGVDAFIVIDIIECHTWISCHQRVRSENGGRNGRGCVNGEKGMDCGELMADFFFLDIEEASDVLDHLLMRESHFIVGRTVRRRRGDKVRGVASAVDQGQRAGWDKDGGR